MGTLNHNETLIPVFFTADQWSFIVAGLRDLAAITRSRVEAMEDPEDREAERQIVQENTDVAAHIEACYVSALDTADTSFWDDALDTVKNVCNNL